MTELEIPPLVYTFEAPTGGKNVEVDRLFIVSQIFNDMSWQERRAALEWLRERMCSREF